MSLTTKTVPTFNLVNSSKIYHWNGHPVLLEVEVKGVRFWTQAAEALYVDFLLGDVEHRLVAQTDETFTDVHVVWMGHRPNGHDWEQLETVSIPKGHSILSFLNVDGKPLSQYKP